MKISEIIGNYFDDLLIAIFFNMVVYYIINFLLKRSFIDKELVSISVSGTAVAILCLSSITHKIYECFTLYLPALFILLVIQLIRVKVRKEIEEENKKELETFSS